MKEDLRRETHGTAVGGDRGADRPVARRRGRREPARVAVWAREPRRAADHPARGRGRVRRVVGPRQVWAAAGGAGRTSVDPPVAGATW